MQQQEPTRWPSHWYTASRTKPVATSNGQSLRGWVMQRMCGNEIDMSSTTYAQAVAAYNRIMARKPQREIPDVWPLEDDDEMLVAA